MGSRSFRRARADFEIFPIGPLDRNGVTLKPGVPTWIQVEGGIELRLDEPKPPAGDRLSRVITLLVADSQRMVAEGLGLALGREKDISVINAFPTNGKTLLRLLPSLNPQVALVDFRMPDMSGPEVTRRILEIKPGLKIILVSWFHSATDIESALDAGAVGFFTKGMSVDQVADGIRRAHAGESPVYLRELDDMMKRLSNRAAETARVLDELRGLSPRELQVLTLLAVGKSDKQVAEDLSLRLLTVKSYVRSMLRKTGCLSIQDVLVKARFSGLIRT